MATHKKSLPKKKPTPAKKKVQAGTKGKTDSKSKPKSSSKSASVTKKTATSTKSTAPRKRDHKGKVFKGQKHRFEQKINKNSLRPGMIISFGYKGQYSHDSNPMVLVLNKRWLGKLHGINLNYCNYKQIIEIGKIVNEKVSPKAQTLGQRYRIVNPQGFYHVMLKPLLRNYKKSIYRTYFISKITEPLLMDYKFKSAGTEANTITFYDRGGKTQVRLTKTKPETIQKRAAGRRNDVKEIKSVSLSTKNPDRQNISQAEARKLMRGENEGLVRTPVKNVAKVANVKVVDSPSIDGSNVKMVKKI